MGGTNPARVMRDVWFTFVAHLTSIMETSSSCIRSHAASYLPHVKVVHILFISQAATETPAAAAAAAAAAKTAHVAASPSRINSFSLPGTEIRVTTSPESSHTLPKGSINSFCKRSRSQETRNNSNVAPHTSHTHT